MNTLKNIFGLFTIALLIISCKNEPQPEVVTVEKSPKHAKVELDPNATYAKAEFNIEGMMCEIGCAKTIEKKLAKMEGVKSVSVNFKKELAMVEFDEAKVNTTSLEETVKKTGETYTVKNMKTVESFSAKASTSSAQDASTDSAAKDKAHPENCDKECCAGKTDAEKKVCSADCKMACCADKKVKTE